MHPLDLKRSMLLGRSSCRCHATCGCAVPCRHVLDTGCGMSKRESARLKAKRVYCRSSVGPRLVLASPKRKRSHLSKRSEKEEALVQTASPLVSSRYDTREGETRDSLPFSIGSPLGFHADALFDMDAPHHSHSDDAMPRASFDEYPLPQSQHFGSHGASSSFSASQRDLDAPLCTRCDGHLYTLAIEVAVNTDQNNCSLEQLCCARCGLRTSRRISGPLPSRLPDRHKMSCIGVIKLCWSEETSAIITVFDSEEMKAVKSLRRCFPSNCTLPHEFTLHVYSAATGTTTEIHCGHFTYQQILANMQRGNLPITKLAFEDLTTDPPSIRNFCEYCNNIDVHTHAGAC